MKAILAAGAVGFALALGSLGFGQDLNHYLRIRRENHISHASSLDALHDAGSSQVLELRGVVSGTFRVAEKTTLLLDRPGGEAQEIETDFMPEWLANSTEPARLLIKTFRPNESTPLRVILLAAARDEEIAKIEAANRPKTAAVRTTTRSTPSARLAYNLGNGSLYGSIGRGGSHLERPRSDWSLPIDETKQVYARYIQHRNPRLNNGEALSMANDIVDGCLHYDIDPRLVVAVVLVESGFDPNSVSSSGAIGLGQLMPGTARWMGVSNSFNSSDNIYGMVKLLSTLRRMFAPSSSSVPELWQKTIAAYNAGDGAVRRFGGIPPYRETQAYVRHVLEWWIRLGGNPNSI